MIYIFIFLCTFSVAPTQSGRRAEAAGEGHFGEKNKIKGEGGLRRHKKKMPDVHCRMQKERMCIRINMLNSNQLQLQVFFWRLCLLRPAACGRVWRCTASAARRWRVHLRSGSLLRPCGGLFLLGVWVKKEKKKEQSRWKHTAGFLGRTDGTAGSSTRHPDDGER